MAGTTGRQAVPNLGAVVDPIRSAITASKVYAELTGSVYRYEATHAPRPVMERPIKSLDGKLIMRRVALRPRGRIGVRRDFPMPSRSELHPRQRRLDPLAMRRSNVRPLVSSGSPTGPSLEPLRSLLASGSSRSAASASPRKGGGVKHLTASTATTGIEHWWTYEARTIPGIGKAMVNVGTGNLVVAATDVDVHEQGIDLAFQRVYNMQSLHDYNGDDGGDPAIFGNRWTNNFDANIVYNSAANTITVYDIDGAACTYTANGNGTWQPCTGEYATLIPTDGTDCTYAWTKTNGTVYWFHTDDSETGCGIAQAKTGHIQEILGRNQLNNITFAYSYSQTPHTSENITEIDANHSDGHSLIMKFGVIPSTSINELMTLKRPDGATLQYSYDTSGNLLQVDKPGNNSAFSLPTNPSGPNPLTGYVPETYAYSSGTSSLAQACGPRCTASWWQNYPNDATDGSSLLFAVDGSLRLKSWQVQGVLNFAPQDGTGTLLQPSLSNDYQTWYTQDFLYGSGSACNNVNAGLTTMCDTDGHSSIWMLDGSDRVTETQDATGDPNSGVPWIVTAQGWDSNNDLTSTTDANGNATDYGYDSGGSGDMVEMQLPSATDFFVNNATITLSPLSYYSHDGNHNITAYCDPVWTNNNNKTWNNSPGESLCPSGNNKTTQLSYNYDDSNEPLGCLTGIAKPSGYSTTISYTGGSGNCGLGLPNQEQGAAIAQYNNVTRTPTQNFTYDAYGNLLTYNKGRDNSNNIDYSWTLAYSPDNQLVQSTENDSLIPLTESSMSCYYPDGSVFYTETPSQRHQDSDPTCPSTNTLLAGPASPQSHANAFYYDLDGDQVKTITHKGCDTNTACPGLVSQTVCNNSETSNPIGTTCKYYDGLDRLVETVAPYDTRQFSGGANYEFYSFRWMDRYIYDLSMSGGSAELTISDETGSTSRFAGYGDLYKTQEYLPQSTSMVATYNQSYPNPGWSDVRGTSFDALDRPVSKYELAYDKSNKNAVATNTYDGTGEYGLLSQTENAVQQIESYTYDGNARQETVQFSGAPLPLAGNRNYAYDPDGRTTLADSANLGILYYTYDVDGNNISVTEPSQEPAASLICYHYYGDGLREFLSVGLLTDTCSSSGNNIPFRSQPSNGGISQPSIFSYAYRNDGVLTYQQVTWGTLSDLFSWNYYPSEREETQTDPLAQQPNPGIAYTPPGNSSPGVTMQPATYSYDSYGRVSGLTLPQGYQESTLIYDTDDELAGANYGDGNGGSARPITLNARGEVLQDGTTGNLNPPTQGVTQSANGAQVGNGDYGPLLGNFYQVPPTTLQFDVRSNMTVCIPDTSWALQITTGPEMLTYDGAGRQVQTSTDPNGSGCSTPNATTTSGINYDAENHIKNVTSPNGDVTGSAVWGADGLQRENNSSGGTDDQQAHWDGNSLLFSTGSSPDVPALYLGKLGEMDLAGDIVILDRDQTGSRMSAHGYVAAPPTWMKGNYWYDGLNIGTVRNIYIAKAGKQYFIPFLAGSCNFTPSNDITYTCPSDPVAFPMKRGDGYAMLGGIVQGARTFDPVSGQWLTPDAYAGDISDPMSQKPFMWNNNNAVQFSDPTGYDAIFQGQDGSGAQPLFTDYYLGDPGYMQATPNAVLQEQEQVAKGNVPLQQMLDAAAQSYLSGPTLPNGGTTRPGTQSVSQLIQNASTYLTGQGVGATESSIAGMPALATSFSDGQTGAMAFSTTVIQIYLNDTQGNEITQDYTEVRWQWDAGGYGQMFNGGYPEYRQPFAGIPSWLPFDMINDVYEAPG